MPQLLFRRQVVHSFYYILISIFFAAESADQLFGFSAQLDGRGHFIAAIVAIVYKVLGNFVGLLNRDYDGKFYKEATKVHLNMAAKDPLEELEEELGLNIKFKSSDFIPFDHRVHRYTLEEIAERLELHIGRGMEYTQFYAKHRISLMGFLKNENGKYFIDNEMHKVDLSTQLTEAIDPVGNHPALYTILEIDRTDAYEDAKREHELRKAGMWVDKNRRS